jgi:hypothetical protein
VPWAKRAIRLRAAPAGAGETVAGAPLSADAAAASASRSSASPGWETSSSSGTPPPVPCWTTCASSCAISSCPAPEAGAYSPWLKTMSPPTV